MHITSIVDHSGIKSNWCLIHFFHVLILFQLIYSKNKGMDFGNIIRYIKSEDNKVLV